MLGEHDKRARSAQFRARLDRALRDAGMSQSALARAVGVDRSTVSQLLSVGSARLPNAQVVAECATALGVSADWLLGLTERPDRPAALMAQSMTVTQAPRTLVDTQILDWHREARGYKIRHVPATLPDMLKTRALLEWEYAEPITRSAAQAIGAAEDRLGLIRNASSDYEIALPRHEVESLAQGAGYYTGMPAAERRAQLAHMAEICDQLYPSLRLYLFEARRVYSAPVTVFGPLLAVLYLGRHYLSFREGNRVASFTEHFDWLVRESETGAREVPALLARLARG